jgi:hypothetical protein
MEEAVRFGSRLYGEMFLLLLLSRGADILSTRIATPNLVLEGNPIARKLGWRWGLLINLALCFGLAFWPVSAIVIGTCSVLVAARNFQGAWLMRTMGEENYRDWHVRRLHETSATLYLFCLFAQTGLVAAVGGAVILFCDRDRQWGLVAVGVGIIAYSSAVLIYTLYGVWRLRRATLRRHKDLIVPADGLAVPPVLRAGKPSTHACLEEGAAPTPD